MPLTAAPNNAIGTANEFSSINTTVSHPCWAKYVPARRARCPSSENDNPPSREPTAIRSARLSLAISKIIPTCIARTRQSEDGKGLAPLTASAVSPIDNEPAPALVMSTSRVSLSSV